MSRPQMMIPIGLSASSQSQKPTKDDNCVTASVLCLTVGLLVDFEASNTYTREEELHHNKGRIPYAVVQFTVRTRSPVSYKITKIDQKAYGKKSIRCFSRHPSLSLI